MRKLSKLFLMIALPALVVVTGCNKDEETDDLRPTIDITACTGCTTADATLNTSTDFTVGINAFSNTTSNKNLDKFEVFRRFDGETTSTLVQEILDINAESFSQEFTMTSSANVGGETFTFRVTDKDGLTEERTIVITTQAASTPLATEVTTGVIWNIIGPNQGAWDLVADQGKSSGDADADKDMANTTTVGSQTPEVFEEEWMALNTTMFVKDNSFDYDNATKESASSAYSSGTASATVSNVAQNDIYIAKLRGGDDYAVIKVTAVDVTTMDNADKIEFSYRKE